MSEKEKLESHHFPQEWLSAYLDGELDQTQTSLVERSLSKDPKLVTILGELKSARFLVRSLASRPVEPIGKHPANVLDNCIAPTERVGRTLLPTERGAHLLGHLDDGLHDGWHQHRDSEGRRIPARKWLALAASFLGLAIVGFLAWMSKDDRTTAWNAPREPGAIESKSMTSNENTITAADSTDILKADPSAPGQEPEPLESLIEEGIHNFQQSEVSSTEKSVEGATRAQSSEYFYQSIDVASQEALDRGGVMNRSAPLPSSVAIEDAASRKIGLAQQSPEQPRNLQLPSLKDDSDEQTGFARRQSNLHFGVDPGPSSNPVTLYHTELWSESEVNHQFRFHPMLQPFQNLAAQQVREMPNDTDSLQAKRAVVEVVLLRIPLAMHSTISASVERLQLTPVWTDPNESVRILFLSSKEVEGFLDSLGEGWRDKAQRLRPSDQIQNEFSELGEARHKSDIGEPYTDKCILILHFSSR